jgi:hypothetical protein
MVCVEVWNCRRSLETYVADKNLVILLTEVQPDGSRRRFAKKE